ncbi:MAG: phosphatase PAP2 family protein [Betaproteobacteria bacterium]
MTQPVPLRSPAAWIVPVVAVVMLAMVALTGTNRPVFTFLNGWSHETGPGPWQYVTLLGDTAVALALFLPFALRRPDVLWALAVSALFAALYVHILKPLVGAPRPPAVLAADAITIIGAAYRARSFPSGHTTTIFLAAAILWLHFRSPWLRAATLAVATMVGLSRAVVGVHWPVDIAAGAAGGWIAACVGTPIARRLSFGLRPAVQWVLTAIGAGCAIALLAGLDTGYPQAVVLQYLVGACALASLAYAIVTRRAGRHDARIRP